LVDVHWPKNDFSTRFTGDLTMNCSTRQSVVASPFAVAQRVLERGRSAQAGPGTLSITECDAGTRFEFDVPGFGTDDISIDVENGYLVVVGTQKERTESGTEVYSERCSGDFRRVLRLDKKLDPATVDAQLDDGVLRVGVSRRPEAERRSITIRSSLDQV
jgi:HSP20 family protein